jgi:hypothetical protein
MCFPVPNKYPSLLKHHLNKGGITVDCPLINNSEGRYIDQMLPSKYTLSPLDAKKVFDSYYGILNTVRGSYLNCVNINNPNSFESCSKGINSPDAKCCYVSGTRGTNSVNLCTVIPSSTYSTMSRLFSQAQAKLDCGSSQ